LSTKISYNKPHLSVSEQIEQLKARNMHFIDEAFAKHYLSHLNYYRLSAYWLPYEENHSTHIFKNGTTFENIYKYYKFDRELRVWVLEAIEKIEVSIRTQMAHELSIKYGTHPHLEESIFLDNDKYKKGLSSWIKEYKRSNEDYSKHFQKKYLEDLPPIWVSVELMSLGQISQWYSNIKQRKDRQVIAKKYQLDEKILKSFLHHLTIVRNICAHHGRLWNRKFRIDTKLANSPENLKNSFTDIGTNKRNIFNTIVYIKYLLDIIEPDHEWHHKLKVLVQDINIKAMGFPEDWDELRIWGER